MTYFVFIDNILTYIITTWDKTATKSHNETLFSTFFLNFYYSLFILFVLVFIWKYGQADQAAHTLRNAMDESSRRTVHI
jgi:uncharacterized membrane protein